MSSGPKVQMPTYVLGNALRVSMELTVCFFQRINGSVSVGLYCIALAPLLYMFEYKYGVSRTPDSVRSTCIVGRYVVCMTVVWSVSSLKHEPPDLSVDWC